MINLNFQETWGEQMKKLSQNNLKVLGFVFISFILMFLSGCMSLEQRMIEDGYKPLTTQELNELFSKHVTMRWTLRNMKQGDAELSPDKKAKLSHAGGIDYGTWSAEDDKLCINWDRFRGGLKECNTWFKIGENKFKVVPNDMLDFMVKIVE